MSAETASFPILEGFDPFSTDFLCDPAPTIRRAQATKPVFYYPPLRMWVITSYDDICRAARDWETFSSKAAGMVPPPDDIKPRIPDTFVAEHFISLDPPEHTTDRTAVSRNFLPRELQKQEPNIRRIANLLIDRFIHKGSCDFMQDPLWIKRSISRLAMRQILGSCSGARAEEELRETAVLSVVCSGGMERDEVFATNVSGILGLMSSGEAPCRLLWTRRSLRVARSRRCHHNVIDHIRSGG